MSEKPEMSIDEFIKTDKFTTFFNTVMREKPCRHICIFPLGNRERDAVMVMRTNRRMSMLWDHGGTDGILDSFVIHTPFNLNWGTYMQLELDRAFFINEEDN